MMDEASAEQVKALVAKGVLGPGAFETDDCRRTYEELSERDVAPPVGADGALLPNRGHLPRQFGQLVQHDGANRAERRDAAGLTAAGACFEDGVQRVGLGRSFVGPVPQDASEA